MTKIKKSLRRLLLPCFSPSAAAVPTASKKRLSTALRDDVEEEEEEEEEEENEEKASLAVPRPSRSMVTGTIFGHRRGRVWFCVQANRLSPSSPMLLVELPLLTTSLAAELGRSPAVRLALESRSDNTVAPLRSSLLWTAFLNGRRLGPAATQRKASEGVRSLLAAMRATTVGAGVVPAAGGLEEVMYMRATYEHVVGGADSESFHLMNPPDESCPSQELSVFLLRSSSSAAAL